MRAIHFKSRYTLQVETGRWSITNFRRSLLHVIYDEVLFATIIEHASLHHRSLSFSLSTSFSHYKSYMHLKLNLAHLAICRARMIPYRSDSVSGQSQFDILLFDCPVAVSPREMHYAIVTGAEYFFKSRIANSTFIHLDTRVACVRFDVFYRDLLLLPFPYVRNLTYYEPNISSVTQHTLSCCKLLLKITLHTFRDKLSNVSSF